jgi:hypothetical protein
MMTRDSTANPASVSFGHPSFAGRIGLCRVDITPPIGIYARSWGAATHDTAESIHRPLTLTALALMADESFPGGGCRPLVLLSADLGWWRDLGVFQSLRDELLRQLSLDSASLWFAVTHTHAAVSLPASTAGLPGGDLVERYREQLLQAALDAARYALDHATEGLLAWHAGRCQLAAVRDLPDPDPARNRWLCGYHPLQKADDTLLLGRVTGPDGRVRATLVHYACHPTTLAWQNRALSPDFVGAMRETIEQATGGAPALYLQGASGDLAPRYQYVGDPAVADRHGRQLGYAALATLEDMEPPGSRLVFERVVESGAPLAVWSHRASIPCRRLDCAETTVEIPLKQWPSCEQLDRQLEACTDRAQQERLRRQRDIRRVLGDGPHYRLPIWIGRMGDAVWVGCMAEAYSQLQRAVRDQFPDRAIACLNLLNGSIGYLPPAELYDSDVYQVWQTPFDRGSLEQVTDAMADGIRTILMSSPQS